MMLKLGRVDSIEVGRRAGTGNVVLTFEKDSGEGAQVDIDQVELAGLISRLHDKLAGPLAPVSVSQLRPGAAIKIRQVSAKSLPDRSLRLDLTAEFPDRVVTIPLDLSPEDVAYLRQEMDK